MELIAVVEAIKAISPVTAPVTIISDSQYVINGMTTWLRGWKAKGWRNAAKAPVKNQDLWEILDSLNTPLITWTWVKGHAGNEWNERADVLANTAAQQAANLNAA
ncbi:ribonuclease HI [Pseudochrobactrum saccharolyticum]|uniref:ribonuclease H n=2 Tax=Pseudochrobactrum saccharolyticum TaxID=354352 RepID=A0A7W8EPI8_9HYPH|nr:ribonuclease HI [Pseudochrobactrum saccharolyticum]